MSSQSATQSAATSKLMIEIGIFIVVILYTAFAGFQWWQLRVTNKLTQQALNNSDKALEQTIAKMQMQIDATMKLSEEARKQSIHTAELATNSSRQVVAVERSADEQQRQVEIASKQVEISQRPILDTVPSVSGPMVFDTGGARVQVSFQVTNEGLTAAENVGMSAQLFPMTTLPSEIAKEVEVTCDIARKSRIYNKTIFRGSPATRLASMTFKRSEMNHFELKGRFVPNLITCTVYNSSILKTQYRETQTYVIGQIIDANNTVLLHLMALLRFRYR